MRLVSLVLALALALLPVASASAEEPRFRLFFGNEGFSFSFGTGDFAPRRDWDPRARVCFYEGTNYTGDRFCLSPGQGRRTLGAWDNRISSIRVSGGAEALICLSPNYRRCGIVDRSFRNLGVFANNAISSVKVR